MFLNKKTSFEEAERTNEKYFNYSKYKLSPLFNCLYTVISSVRKSLLSQYLNSSFARKHIKRK